MSLDGYCGWNKYESHNPPRRIEAVNNYRNTLMNGLKAKRAPKKYTWRHICRARMPESIDSEDSDNSIDVMIVDWNHDKPESLKSAPRVDASDTSHIVAVVERFKNPKLNRWCVAREYRCCDESAASEAMDRLVAGLMAADVDLDDITQGQDAYERVETVTGCLFYYKDLESKYADAIDFAMEGVDGRRVSRISRFPNEDNWDEDAR